MKAMQREQGGMVLIVSLLLLLVLAILATTTSETNILQLQMAGNDQAKAESMQHAFAIVDSIIDNRDNTAVVGDVGYKLCDSDASTRVGITCNEELINIDSGLVDPDADVGYYVQRVGPEITSAPFLDEDFASSSASFSVARQEVTVTYDRSDERLGKVEIVQGLLRLIPKLSQ